MKYFIPIVLLYFIEIDSVSSEELCSEIYKNDLPARFLRWKRPDYGLEFTTDPVVDEEISKDDKIKEIAYNDKGPDKIKQIITEHLKKIQINESQFDIERLDPIEYIDPSNTEMWLILKNISLFNLDTYDPDSIKYHRKGYREQGTYKLTQDIYEHVNNVKKSNKKARQFLKKIDESDLTYERTDTKWNITVSAKFKSEIPSDKNEVSIKTNTPQNKESESSLKPEDEPIVEPIIKPIIIKAEFKIQPQKKENESSSSSTTSKGPEPLRASGVLTLHVYDFGFELTIIDRHIDHILSENLPENKRCKNRVPDFDVQYSLRRLDIYEIKLTKYDKDDEYQIEPENDNEDVNDNEIKTIDKTDPVPRHSEKVYDFMEEDVHKLQEVKQHLDILREKIQDNGEEIRKRLCINIMPKMAWKTMKMESKRQLPALIRQIIQYNRNFKIKSPPPEATSMGMVEVAQTIFALSKAVAKFTWGG